MQALRKTRPELSSCPSSCTISYEDRKQQSHRAAPRPPQNLSAITCFTPGTGIATLNGLVDVAHLKVGDRVLTRDRGFQPIRWIGNRHLTHKDIIQDTENLPILIRAHALGQGLPERDIIVSPRHKMLTTDKSLLSCLSETEALIEANALLGQPGIMQVIPHCLTYIHILFDQHEVILSNNLWSESFHLSRRVAAALLKEHHSAIRVIFPQIDAEPDASPQALARMCLNRAQITELRA